MKFYELSDAGEFKNADWGEEMDFEETIYCPGNPEHQRAGKRKTNLIIELPSPRIGDFIWTWLSECVITEKVVKLLEKENFTGYKLMPVVVDKVKRGNKSQIPPLWELVVVGSGGDAHPDSGIYLKYECKTCGLREYSPYKNGIIVDERNWDGSDFFTVTGYPKHILITERVVDFIKKHKLTNVKLTHSNELKWPEELSYELE